MEGLSPLHRRVAGIDVHRMLHVVTVLIEVADGSIVKHQREFGGFKRDMKAMALWLLELGVERVVMESTGIYWKSAPGVDYEVLSAKKNAPRWIRALMKIGKVSTVKPAVA